jgi:hypothetical protein
MIQHEEPRSAYMQEAIDVKADGTVGKACGESTARQPESKAQCIACKSELNPGATLCQTCKTPQSKWKSWLQYIASIVGVFTLLGLLGSLSVYTVSGWPTVRKQLFWKDKVKVLSFNSNQDLVITNMGDGDIFLSHVDLRAHGPDVMTSILRIGISVPTGDVAKHRFSRDHQDIKEQPVMKLVSDVSEAAWKEASRRATHRDDPCFAIIFYYAEDPSYRQLESAHQGKLFQTIPATATLHFYSVGSKKALEEAFPVVGTVALRSIPTCPQ